MMLVFNLKHKQIVEKIKFLWIIELSVIVKHCEEGFVPSSRCVMNTTLHHLKIYLHFFVIQPVF